MVDIYIVIYKPERGILNSKTLSKYAPVHTCHPSIASPVFPPSPPPLLPSITVKGLLPKLVIDSVMRLTHPPSKVVP